MTAKPLDNGLELNDVALSMLRVYARCTEEPEPGDGDLLRLVLDGDLGNGWLAAAGFVAALYQGSLESEASLPASELAARLVEAFAGGADIDLPPLASFPARQRLAWEAVARHGASVLACDEDDTGGLLTAEAAWRPWVEQAAHTRGLSL